MRDDPLPLASMAADLLERAARRVQPDEELRAILAHLSEALPVLRADEPHLLLRGEAREEPREGVEAEARRRG